MPIDHPVKTWSHLPIRRRVSYTTLLRETLRGIEKITRQFCVVALILAWGGRYGDQIWTPNNRYYTLRSEPKLLEAIGFLPSPPIFSMASPMPSRSSYRSHIGDVTTPLDSNWRDIIGWWLLCSSVESTCRQAAVSAVNWCNVFLRSRTVVEAEL